MSITTTDRIIGPARGSAREAVAFADEHGALRMADVRAYLTEVYRLAPLVGLDPAIMVAQSCHETDNWRSPAWVDWLNPAGLGITYSGQDPGYRWDSGTDAARAQIVHLIAYVYGASWPQHWDSAELGGPPSYDPRFHLVMSSPNRGIVRTLNDLTGKWATDPQYAGKIAAKGNALFPGIPDQQEEPSMPDIQFGKVPRPRITDDIVNKPEGNGWGDYGPRQLRAVVLHRVVGAARYTSGHFRNLSDPHGRNALTDWGVCGALDGDMDGVILKWNDPDSRRSPWASGPASGLNGDAIAFASKYAVGGVGLNVFNRDTEAVELSGRYDTPLTAKQLEAACQLIAYRLDAKMQLPWNVWPKNHDGVQAILWHGEVNGWEKPCPGKVVIDATDAIIARVGQILRHYQTAGVPVPAPEPEPEPIEKHALPKGMSEAMARRQFNPFKITHPDTGQRIVFDRGKAPFQVWLKWGKDSMTTDDWRSGSWPPLVSVIREGDGDETWKWAAGPQYERKAA